jgi:DNA-binding transcriptional regulator YhcF (GntR family)
MGGKKKSSEWHRLTPLEGKPSYTLHQRLNGIREIAKYMGVSAKTFKNTYQEQMNPYIFHIFDKKGKSRLFTFTNLVQTCLLERELEQAIKKDSKAVPSHLKSYGPLQYKD